uniref:Proline iminopeptidase n=1 Tax=Candidatus Kentrum sp. UNK TaxID=2126344 RepID=A0A451ANH2_9GAMM|nr:MAG: proline iminopeptidase [Candidatus Kentron sp. UNK]VFK72747.1 MAG: proline iminopeptidase [Candidatus Kentron sp. UNK]
MRIHVRAAILFLCFFPQLFLLAGEVVSPKSISEMKLVPGEYDAVMNGIRIHYTIRGSGPALMAHSGGPGIDARGWDDFAGIDEFATVIVIHPRGSGLSAPAPDDAYSLSDYALDLEALRLHLGLEKPIMLGWSHGGIVAQQFASTYPDSLSKLILVSTSAYFGEFLGNIETAVRVFEDRPWYRASLAALKQEWAGEYETDEDMTRLWAHEMKFYFKDFNERAMSYHERTRDLPFRAAPLKVFNAGEAATLDLRPRLKDISVPTLVIVGRHDFITNVAMAQEMVERIPDARLAVFEGSGHFAWVEEPERFHRVIERFILAE